MAFRTLKSLIQPISRALTTNSSTQSLKSSHNFLPKFLFTNNQLQSHTNLLLLPNFTRVISRSVHLENLSSLAPRPFDPLTDTRFRKRRPSYTGRPKRSSLRPPGPYAWVKHVAGEVVQPSQPNKGSVKLRNEKKRRRQRLEFIKSERKKRKAELQAANRKKREKSIERKMEAVARDREWAQRLAELQRLEAEKKQKAA